MKDKTLQGKINQLIFLSDRSATIVDCRINSDSEIIKLYFNPKYSTCSIISTEFNFEEVDKAIETVKEVINAEIEQSYTISNMNISQNYKRYNSID